MPKYTSSILIGCLIVLFGAAISFAEMRSFSHVSVEVPNGWEVLDKGDTLALVAPKRKAVISFSVKCAYHMSAKELAQMFSSQHHGTTPKPLGENTYMFSFKNSHGKTVGATLTVSKLDNEFVLCVIAGNHPDLDTILNHFKILWGRSVQPQ